MSRPTPSALGQPDAADAPEGRATGSLATELAAAIEAARAAGAAIREVYRGSDDDLRFKVGDDPLTVADESADRIIRERLRAAFPADAWLSEESDATSTDDGAPMDDDGVRTWVVDPLDGTREFVDRIPEFAVSIALLEGGWPVVAVVYQPIVDVLVAAVRGGGVTANGEPARVSDHAELASARVVASRSEVKRGQWAPLEADCRVVPTGSIAWKLALVACGQADATISLAPKHGWDVAAGVLLVEEAGGRVAGLDGSRLSLHRPVDLLDGLIASNDRIFEAVTAKVQKVRAPG